jgi:hypothetical protein
LCFSEDGVFLFFQPSCQKFQTEEILLNGYDAKDVVALAKQKGGPPAGVFKWRSGIIFLHMYNIFTYLWNLTIEH